MQTTRKQRVSMSEQIRLITECRRSGMTDADWCREHGIAPSTFYNWVSRCRKAAADQIPAPSYGHQDSPRPKQDVVAIDLVPDTIPEQSGAPAALQEHQLLCRLIWTLTIHIRSRSQCSPCPSASKTTWIRHSLPGHFVSCRNSHVRRYIRAGKDLYRLRPHRYAQVDRRTVHHR